MKILINEKISPHRYKDNHGYLICTDCIMARTGKQTYTRDECFGDGDNTEIEVDRPSKEVFDAKTMASFENVPITIEHPSVNVDPDNYNTLSVGHMRDIRKGTYEGQPVMVGTAVITDSEAIEKVESGDLTNLSCGYDCDIDDSDNPYQFNIRGNHIALCECPRAGITHIQDSKAIKDMSLSRGDAIDVCMSLGEKFIEHFHKIYSDSTNEAVNHWASEMNSWFYKAKGIKLKSNNCEITETQLRDWFFTAGANFTDFIDACTNDEERTYDKFIHLVIDTNDVKTAVNKLFNKSYTKDSKKKYEVTIDSEDSMRDSKEKYYFVKEVRNEIGGDNWYLSRSREMLIPGELLTEKELIKVLDKAHSKGGTVFVSGKRGDKLLRVDDIVEEIYVNPKDTHYFFGARKLNDERTNARDSRESDIYDWLKDLIKKNIKNNKEIDKISSRKQLTNYIFDNYESMVDEEFAREDDDTLKDIVLSNKPLLKKAISYFNHNPSEINELMDDEDWATLATFIYNYVLENKVIPDIVNEIISRKNVIKDSKRHARDAWSGSYNGGFWRVDGNRITITRKDGKWFTMSADLIKNRQDIYDYIDGVKRPDRSIKLRDGNHIQGVDEDLFYEITDKYPVVRTDKKLQTIVRRYHVNAKTARQLASFYELDYSVFCDPKRF